MIYTSGAPRYTDPEPWRYPDGQRQRHDPGNFAVVYDPRPEYALPPSPSANPYLVALREYIAAWPEPSPVIAREWLALHSLLDVPRYRAGSSDDPILRATAAHYGHALRVLERLAAL